MSEASGNYKIWYARGFTARAKHVDFPGQQKQRIPGGTDLISNDGDAFDKSRDPVVVLDKAPNFKGDDERRHAFHEGWNWANVLFSHNRAPYEVADVVALENREWAKATGRKLS